MGTVAGMRPMTETQLQEQIRRMCAMMRLLYYHTHRSQHSPAGFPDAVIVGPGGALFRELKDDRPGNRPSAAQQEWLDGLREVGFDTGLWRPADLRSGRITAELTAIRKKAGR